ncbi:membrane protein [Micromonospora coerulea]|uniref:Membrane protein n=1 Tax=Micromonospora coerulea TaxID=47856 RepID=A0ABP8SEZ7_9ACTN
MSRLSPATRKALLTLHLVTSLGWLGADLVLLTLGVAGLRGADPAVVYPTAGLVVTYLFAPLSVVVWLVGVASALLTPWGLLRWRWVLVKFALTTVMLGLVLLLLTPRIRQLGELGAAATTHYRVDLVVAPAVSTTLLLVATVLSTYKPWGRLRPAIPARRSPVAAGRRS